MPDVPQLAKAELRELDAKFKNTINKDKWTKVQFNPDTLKVTFANQIQQPSGSGDQRGSQAQQFVGAGTTKLAIQLWFDVTHDLGQGLPDVIDVRQLTQRVAYFITPIGEPKNDPKTFIPPAVRFLWGTFQFDGIVESMEENLELFSFEGRPLRASVALAISQQKITTFAFNQANQPPSFTRRNRAPAGTQQQTEAPKNSNVQSLAGSDPATGGRDWQSVAIANGIENPRLLQPGQLIDMSATTPRIVIE
jgi:hypothetical protein